jgi:8-oxo-dGTP pyrophosphatase MutT (NUDIX family)
MERLRQALLEYTERYPEEAVVAERFLSLLQEGEIAFLRDRLPGHLTASGWTVDPNGERVLLVHHRKLHKWLQPGGHADGEQDLPAVARKEVLEETGLEASSPFGDLIFDLDVHRIPARGEVPEHEHFDVRYLLQAEGEPAKNDESHEVRWVSLNDVEELTREESILRMREKLEVHRGDAPRGAATYRGPELD